MTKKLMRGLVPVSYTHLFPYSGNRVTLEDQKIIDRAISYMELEGFQDRFIDELSGGQRQRAMIAMVIAQDTEYVLLDEPTNNLDIYHATNMMKIVRRLCDEPVSYTHLDVYKRQTHGEPNDVNAHPHVSQSGKLAVVHNGIIENYLEIKQSLLHKGVVFASDTDTEVIVQLLEYYYKTVSYTHLTDRWQNGRPCRRAEGN